MKRAPIKYIRDYCKSEYQYGTACVICGSTDRTDFHHFHSVTALFEKWCKVNKITKIDIDNIFKIREEFLLDNYKEMTEDGAELCHKHHEALHLIFGSKPVLTSAPKQRAWVEKQKEKYVGKG